MKIDRLIGIVVLLLNRRHVTAGELADYFEVSERTIYRDIDVLGRAGIPVTTTQGAGGGVGLMDGFVLDRQIISADDISSIVTALKGLSSLFDDNRYVTAREKVESLVPDRARSAVEREQEVVSVDLLPWGHDEKFRAALGELRQAALERRVVAFRYGSADGEITRRTVEPVSLHLKGYTWYLYAWCRLRGAFRLFKLSRIREIEVGRERFEPRPGAEGSPAALKNDWTSDSRKPAKLHLRFAESARARAEEFFGVDELSSTPEGIDVTVIWPVDEWLYEFLLGFGGALTVIGPPEVRAEIRRRARTILSNYESSKGT